MPSLDFAATYLDPDTRPEPSQMRQALQQALVSAARQKSTLVLAARNNPYEIDGPIDLREAAEAHIVVDGQLTNIVTDTGKSRSSQAQTVFTLGNHHPVNWNLRGDQTASDVAGLSFLSCGSAKRGDMSVSCGQAPNFAQGAILLMRSRIGFAGAGGHERPDFLQLARVERMEGDTVTLDRPIEEDVEELLVANSSSDIARDLMGNGLFVADRITIEGRGRLASNGHVFQRTAAFECRIDIAETSGASVYFGNCFAYCRFHIAHATANRKAIDISGGSHGSTFEVDTLDFEGPGTDKSCMLINENSRDNVLRIGTLNAPLYQGNGGVLRVLAARRNHVRIDKLHAPSTLGTAITFGRTAEAKEGAFRTEDNVVEIGEGFFGTSLNQFVQSSADPRVRRNKVENSTLRGHPSIRAAQFRTAGVEAINVQFEAGDVRTAQTMSGKQPGKPEARRSDADPGRTRTSSERVAEPPRKKGLFGLW